VSTQQTALAEVRESLEGAVTVSALLARSRRLREIALQSDEPASLFVASQVLAEIARARDERPIDPRFVQAVADRLVPLLDELLDSVAHRPADALKAMDAVVVEFLSTPIAPPRP